jgi:D-alanyl-D-alanine dipeptidase
MRSFTVVIFFIFSFSAIFCRAQPCKTDAKVISNKVDLLLSVKNDPAKKFVDLRKAIPGMVIDLRYATAGNFTKTVLYHHPQAYLREAPANALKQVQDELHKKGLALKLYDAFRPFSVTCKIWRIVPDRRYAANPRKGSNHNRGLAVDVTIVDMKSGKELDMGTAFDSFTDTAHHSFTQLPAQVLANRQLLKNTMWKHGFGLVPDEWWHYQWKNNHDYEVIDLDFDDLKEIVQ